MSDNIQQLANYDDRVLYQVTLSNDEAIQTTVTSCPSAVNNWICHIESMHRYRLHNLIVGLDVEWKPNDDRYNNNDNPVSVLQLCVGHHCLVFQIERGCAVCAYDGMPQALENFLCNQDYTFVGVGIDNDAQKLYHDYGLRTWNTVDLRVLASIRYNEPQLRNVGLVSLTKTALDLDYLKSKSITRSDWSQPNLSEAQIRYAAIDAFLSFEIGRVLNAAHFQV